MPVSVQVRAAKMLQWSLRRTRSRRQGAEANLIVPSPTGPSLKICENRRSIISCCAPGLCHLAQKMRRMTRISDSSNQTYPPKIRILNRPWARTIRQRISKKTIISKLGIITSRHRNLYPSADLARKIRARKPIQLSATQSTFRPISSSRHPGLQRRKSWPSNTNKRFLRCNTLSGKKKAFRT